MPNQDKPLKVWVVNQYAVPPNMPGITRHFELISDWLSAQEINISVWLSSFNYSLRRYLRKDEIEEINRNYPKLTLKWLWAFPHKDNDWRRIVNMISFTILFFFKSLFSRKPNVIIGSSPQIFVVYAALLIAKMFRVKFILEIRDLWPETLIAMRGSKKGILIKILENIEKRLYAGSDHIVVLTQYQKEYIQSKGVPKDQVTLIPNGVKVNGVLENISENALEYKEKLGLPQTAFIAMYTGAHGAANALSKVVLAGEYLEKNQFIVLFGDGPEKPKLKKIVEERGLENVRFFDAVPKNEIMKYTSAADCCIISLDNNPVFNGARPNKLFDYMFLGKPIISTIGGEIGHILKQNQVGWSVEEGIETEKQIASLINKAQNLSEKDKEVIKVNGLNYIMKEGNREITAKNFLEIIKNLSVSGRNR